jgi:hypothetical protein
VRGDTKLVAYASISVLNFASLDRDAQRQEQALLGSEKQ